MFLVGATLEHGNLVTKPELGVIGLPESSARACIYDISPIVVVIIFVPLWITNKCLFKLSNRIGRHNRINDRLCG